MAITLDILKAQEGLTGLSEEQMQSIVGLSERDEETVVSRKYGEMHRQMESIIAAESAIKRNNDEKSGDYLTRALRTMKASADEGATHKADAEALRAEVAKLKENIAKGSGDEHLKSMLEQKEKDLASAKRINGELQAALTRATAEYQGKLEGYKMDSEIGAALGGLKFRKELPEATRQALVTLASQNVRNAKHVYDETAGVFVFQDEEGNPLKDKSLNNLTVGAVLMSELEKMGVLDNGRELGGAGGDGSRGGSGAQGAGADVDLSGAKSRVEAFDVIERQLMANGHAKSDADWHELVDKAWEANKERLSKLPLR